MSDTLRLDLPVLLPDVPFASELSARSSLSTLGLLWYGEKG